jgi:PEP-CTERM motif-containing protein
VRFPLSLLPSCHTLEKGRLMIPRQTLVKTLIVSLAIFAVVLGSLDMAAAAITAQTNFNDITGGGAVLIPQGGGTGWSTTWLSTAALDSSGPNNVLVTTVGSNNREEVLTTAGNGGTAFRGLNTALTDSLNNTAYIHFDAQNLNDGLRFWGISLFSGTTERMLIGQGTGFTHWTINNTTTTSNTLSVAGTVETSIDDSDPANLLVKIVFGGFGSPETLKFWVNPNYGVSENDAANNAALIGTFTTALDWGSIDRLRIGSGNNSGANTYAAHWIDNLEINDSSPFVPEPTTGMLLMLGSFGLSAIRIRRSRLGF